MLGLVLSVVKPTSRKIAGVEAKGQEEIPLLEDSLAL
jgi:hypothetical protein